MTLLTLQKQTPTGGFLYFYRVNSLEHAKRELYNKKLCLLICLYKMRPT